MNPGTPHADVLLERMERLLQAWRPEHLSNESQLEIPLLTDALRDVPDAQSVSQAPIPAEVPRELLQAHLAVAAEQVMRELYRELAADLNERIKARLRGAVDQAIEQALQSALTGLRRQILVCVAESLTDTIEHLGRTEQGPEE